MSRRFGIIAEDRSDVEVLEVLAKKITAAKFRVFPFVGHGCSKVRRKVHAWCENLALKGCGYVVVVHDRDGQDAAVLRSTLEAALPKTKHVTTSVVIPTEELEAWLLSDVEAIARAMRLRRAPRCIHHPERVRSPKEHLGDLIRKASSKRTVYVNTVHNLMIARELDLQTLRGRCPSFDDFHRFVKGAMK